MVAVFSSGHNSLVLLAMVASFVQNSYKSRVLSNGILRSALGQNEERKCGYHCVENVPRALV